MKPRPPNKDINALSRELLSRAINLTPEQKAAIYAELPHFNPSQKLALYKKAKANDQKQTQLFEELIHQKPDFVAQTKGQIAHLEYQAIKEEELANKSQEEDPEMFLQAQLKFT